MYKTTTLEQRLSVPVLCAPLSVTKVLRSFFYLYPSQQSHAYTPTVFPCMLLTKSKEEKILGDKTPILVRYKS
jgi:hypothetical protein